MYKPCLQKSIDSVLKHAVLLHDMLKGNVVTTSLKSTVYEEKQGQKNAAAFPEGKEKQRQKVNRLHK